MKKHVIFSILTLLAIVILYYTEFAYGVFYWARFFCLLLYFIYFMRYIFQNVYKLKLSISISIFLFAVLSNIIWLIELLNHGWEGLIWLKYKHIAFYIISGLFICWLLFINRKTGLKNILYKSIAYGFVYLLFMLVFSDTFYALFNLLGSYLTKFLVYVLNFPISEENEILYYGLIVLIQMAFIFAFNILIAKIEKQRINVLLILCTILIIPLATKLAAYLVIVIFNIPIYDLFLDPIHWLKTGAVIFGFIIYECSYIAFLNKRS